MAQLNDHVMVQHKAKQGILIQTKNVHHERSVLLMMYNVV